MKMKKRFCSSCVNGMDGTVANPAENDNEPAEATYYVTAMRWNDERKVPYRAYLCKEHLEIELENAEHIKQRSI